MREQILRLLKQCNGEFISGEAISEKLGVTRAAIWKHMKALQQEGVQIEAVTRKGYRLIALPQRLQANEIMPLLHTHDLGRNLSTLLEAPSTNMIARELVQQGCPHGTVITAEQQTAGRGRRGRNWSNSPGKDICMSLVLRPKMETQHAPRFTIGTALGVYRAVSAFGLLPSIKWPNDVLLGPQLKKISGILLEMEGNLETLEAIIVGIGLNVNTQSFAPELVNTASSLMQEAGRRFDRVEVLTKLLDTLEPIYDACEDDKGYAQVLSDYRKCCSTLGQSVCVTGIQETFYGVAQDVDALGRLIVRLEDGSTRIVGAGDVSVRTKA